MLVLHPSLDSAFYSLPRPFLTLCVCLSFSDDHYDISLSGCVTRSPRTRSSLLQLRFLTARLSACLSVCPLTSLSLSLSLSASFHSLAPQFRTLHLCTCVKAQTLYSFSMLIKSQGERVASSRHFSFYFL